MIDLKHVIANAELYPGPSTVRILAEELATAQNRIAELEKALEPFAHMHTEPSDWTSVPNKMLWDADAALKRKGA